MDRNQRTTPLGIWRYGYDYLRAAVTLDDADPNPWVASNVTHQCVCQGIELAFKSYLLARGGTLNDLKTVGHSLMRSMVAAEDLRLTPLSPEHRDAMEMMDRYYREHEFRHIVTGLKEYPNLSRLLSAGATILYNAAPDVESAMGSNDLVHRMRLDLSAVLGQTPPA